MATEAIEDDASLEVFMRGMRKFNQQICDMLANGNDFTIRLEVRGNDHAVLHCRSYLDEIERTPHVPSNRK